jgi:transcriptional regulator with XRE-family HTH domain
MESKPSQSYLQQFGEHLKKQREAKGYSLRSLSAMCTIDHSDIGKIEKGEKNITLLTLLELATALETTPNNLLDFEFASH